MPRRSRKIIPAAMTSNLKRRLQLLRSAAQRRLPKRRVTKATAKPPIPARPASKTAAKAKVTPRRSTTVRVPPSKRAPHTSRKPRALPAVTRQAMREMSSSVRPAVGAPPVAMMAPSTAPPLTGVPLPGVAAPSAPPAVSQRRGLPQAYGVTSLVLLVRDPWWLYALWEVTPERVAEVQHRMSAEERHQAEWILRLYDVTDRGAAVEQAHRMIDVVLSHDADNWFVDTGAAHRTWVAELGFRTAQGRFFALVRSNVVTTPRAGPSEEFDAAWMTTEDDYWKLLGVVYGLGFGTSSFDVRRLLERRFREVISSARGSGGVPASGGAFAPTIAR